MQFPFQAGDLIKWLSVVHSNGLAGAHKRAIPAEFVEHLINLRVARRDASGELVITDKGRLSLHMDRPDALHKQTDPDEDPAPQQDAPPTARPEPD